MTTHESIDVRTPSPAVTAFGLPDWRAAIWSSVIAGLVFAALEMILVWAIQGQSPWAPLHLIAGLVMGPAALASPDTFDLPIVLTAVVLHMVLAIVYGIVLAFAITKLETGAAIVAGVVYGLALYAINFYGFSHVFPGWESARGGISIFTHVVQSGLMAGLYKLMERDHAPA